MSELFENPLNWLILGLLISLVLYVVSRIRIVPQASVSMIERMGRYLTMWSSGLHFLYPFIDRQVKVTDFSGKTVRYINLNERTICFPVSQIQTFDQTPVGLNVIINLQIVDPKLFVYGSVSPAIMLERMVIKTTKEVVKDYDSLSISSNHAAIRGKIEEILKEKLVSWGVRPNRVDIGKPYPEKPTYSRI